MTCNEVQKFLEAYIDGELDLVHNLEIERHIQDCLNCQNAYQNNLTIRKSIRSGTLYYEMPVALQKRVHNSLQKVISQQTSLRSNLFPRRGLLLTVAVAGVIVLLAVSSLVLLLNLRVNESGGVNDEIVASHIRSLMVNHLADVASTDQHTVKPWFDGKLDFSPEVPDFAAQGYPLIGGRLDYLEKQPAVALVYTRGKHVINVFNWRNNNPSLKENVRTTTIQGYHLFHWSQNGFDYGVVSDLGEADLATFVNLIKPVISGP